MFLLISVCTPCAFSATTRISREASARKTDFDGNDTVRIVACESAQRALLDDLANRFSKGHDREFLSYSRSDLVYFLSAFVPCEVTRERRDNKRYICTVKAETNQRDAAVFLEATRKDSIKKNEFAGIGKNIDEEWKKIITIREGKPNKQRFADLQRLYREYLASIRMKRTLLHGYTFVHSGKLEEARRVFTGLTPSSARHTAHEQTIKVKARAFLTDSTPLRSGPGNSAVTTGVVRKGSTYDIIAEKGSGRHAEWYRIQVSNKKDGWVRGSAVKKIEIRQKSEKSSPRQPRAHPVAAHAYGALSVVHLKTGQPKDAVHVCSRALALRHDYPLALNNRGVASIDLGNYKNAVEDLTRAIEHMPRGATAFINRGYAFTELEDYDRAEKDLDRAINLEEDNENAYGNRARLYTRKGEYQKALDDYSRAIHLNPDFAVAYVGRGIVYGIVREKDKALTDLDRAIELDPKNVDAYYSRGTIHLNSGNEDRAMEDYKHAARLGDREARKFLKSKEIDWQQGPFPR